MRKRRLNKEVESQVTNEGGGGLTIEKREQEVRETIEK